MQVSRECKYYEYVFLSFYFNVLCHFYLFLGRENASIMAALFFLLFFILFILFYLKYRVNTIITCIKRIFFFFFFFLSKDKVNICVYI